VKGSWLPMAAPASTWFVMNMAAPQVRGSCLIPKLRQL
jgi:hypothetical protein